MPRWDANISPSKVPISVREKPSRSPVKISGRADIEGVPSGVMDMCFENDPDDFADLFSTHPSVTKRVQALIETAGGRMPAMPPHPPKIGERQDLPTMVEETAARGPWARPPQGPGQA